MCDKSYNSYFQYSKLTFLREGLETITKILYPKVYEFYPEIIPLKFKPKSFTHEAIRIVDNGKTVTLVVGDEVKTTVLLSMLGVKVLDDALEWR